MARIAPLDANTLSPEQKEAYDRIAGRRGVVPQPMQVLLRSPELADKAQALGQYLRFNSALEPRLSELAIMVTARHWDSEYEWAAHKKPALEAGLAPEALADIAARRVPKFTREDEQAVYDFATGALREKNISEELCRRTLAVLGERRMVDLIGVIGFYDLIAIVVNSFALDRHGNAPAELAP